MAGPDGRRARARPRPGAASCCSTTPPTHRACARPHVKTAVSPGLRLMCIARDAHGPMVDPRLVALRALLFVAGPEPFHVPSTGDGTPAHVLRGERPIARMCVCDRCANVLYSPVYYGLMQSNRRKPGRTSGPAWANGSVAGTKGVAIREPEFQGSRARSSRACPRPRRAAKRSTHTRTHPGGPRRLVCNHVWPSDCHQKRHPPATAPLSRPGVDAWARNAPHNCHWGSPCAFK
jgi:hypothetical protein